MLCFNSTMVRLKVELERSRLWRVVFQFHNGSIKGGRGIFDIVNNATFQFHNGSIKGKC